MCGNGRNSSSHQNPKSCTDPEESAIRSSSSFPSRMPQLAAVGVSRSIQSQMLLSSDRNNNNNAVFSVNTGGAPTTNARNNDNDDNGRWSHLETPGMRKAKCSLLIQDDGNTFDPRVKRLAKQRVRVYQDKGYNHESIARYNNYYTGADDDDDTATTNNFFVDFEGCTILQLEPSARDGILHPLKTMPTTLTVGGCCVFTPENFRDFGVMMRTKEQSSELNIPPNGDFDWPDVRSLMTCPLCGQTAPVPIENSENDGSNSWRQQQQQQHYHHNHDEYWLLFYPLIQITVRNGSEVVLGTRMICRLTCLDCMDELVGDTTCKVCLPLNRGRKAKATYALNTKDVLRQAGTASFLEDGPPIPLEMMMHEQEQHQQYNSKQDGKQILDAWNLYNLWEHSGAWEALQDDYNMFLSRSMRS